MSTVNNLGGGSLPQVTSTIAGIGGGAVLLPKTGSDMMLTAFTLAALVAASMLLSMGVSKLVRKFR